MKNTEEKDMNDIKILTEVIFMFKEHMICLKFLCGFQVFCKYISLSQSEEKQVFFKVSDTLTYSVKSSN